MDSSLNSETDSKLSVLALFDDMCRFSDQLIESAIHEEDVLQDLVEHCNKNRNDWLSDRKELKKLRNEVNRLKIRVEETNALLSIAIQKNINLSEKTNTLQNRIKNLQELLGKSDLSRFDDSNEKFVWDYIEQSLKTGAETEEEDSSIDEPDVTNEGLISNLFEQIDINK